MLEADTPQRGHGHLGHQHPMSALQALHEQDEADELPGLELRGLASSVMDGVEAEMLGGAMVHGKCSSKVAANHFKLACMLAALLKPHGGIQLGATAEGCEGWHPASHKNAATS